jgi:hypothetical protein
MFLFMKEDSMDIQKFSLKNGGGFVARIHVIAHLPTPTANVWGKEQVFEDQTDIPLGQEHEVDPGRLGVPDGSQVKLKAFVVWGNDNSAAQAFIYKSAANRKARYTITGTTGSNELGLIEAK